MSSPSRASIPSTGPRAITESPRDSSSRNRLSSAGPRAGSGATWRWRKPHPETSTVARMTVRVHMHPRYGRRNFGARVAPAPLCALAVGVQHPVEQPGFGRADVGYHLDGRLYRDRYVAHAL